MQTAQLLCFYSVSVFPQGTVQVRAVLFLQMYMQILQEARHH